MTDKIEIPEEIKIRLSDYEEIKSTWKEKLDFEITPAVLCCQYFESFTQPPPLKDGKHLIKL